MLQSDVVAAVAFAVAAVVSAAGAAAAVVVVARVYMKLKYRSARQELT